MQEAKMPIERKTGQRKQDSDIGKQNNHPAMESVKGHEDIWLFVFDRLRALEDDGQVRVKIMARILLTLGKESMECLAGSTDDYFKNYINELKRHLTYNLFQTTSDVPFEPKGLPYGGALLRTLLQVPEDRMTYFDES